MICFIPLLFAFIFMMINSINCFVYISALPNLSSISSYISYTCPTSPHRPNRLYSSSLTLSQPTVPLSIYADMFSLISTGCVFSVCISCRLNILKASSSILRYSEYPICLICPLWAVPSILPPPRICKS